MLHWPEFKRAAPKIAAVGERLLDKPDTAEVAILATLDSERRPRVAPFCPIFTEKGVYILAASRTPKARHLGMNPAYSLHALLGPDDLEFQVTGAAKPVNTKRERSEVIAAIRFPSFDATDPIYELQISQALAVMWPEPGQQEKLFWAF